MSMSCSECKTYAKNSVNWWLWGHLERGILYIFKNKTRPYPLNLKSSMSLTKDQIRDKKKFYVVNGEEGFSPERNKAIVEETIKEYELKRKRKMEAYNEAIAERSEAVVSYLTSSKVGTPVEQYFGKRTLARLRGEDIVNTLKTGLIFPRR